MQVIFVSGNRSIKNIVDTELDKFLKENLAPPYEVIVGDADGADALIQRKFRRADIEVTVYYSGISPRNTYDRCNTKFIQAYGSGLEWHQYKDKEMAERCNMHIGLVDCTKSTWRRSGTVANHEKCLADGKPSFLFCVGTSKLLEL